MAYLISQGHHLSDIWKYSIRQLNSFIQIAAQEERKAQSTLVWSNRIAYHADGKEYSKIMKELGKSHG